jgi:hypothetical protein
MNISKQIIACALSETIVIGSLLLVCMGIAIVILFRNQQVLAREIINIKANNENR